MASKKTRRSAMPKAVYSLLLNPHASVKLSTCVKCRRPTFARTFGLLIGVEGWGPYVQGKTCKYCARCKLIMVQQDELEEELARAVRQQCPAALGNEYSLFGVIELKHLNAGLSGKGDEPAAALEHATPIRKQHGLEYSPGGWYPEGAEPRVLPSTRPQIVPREA